MKRGLLLVANLLLVTTTTAYAQITVRGRLAHDLEILPGQTVEGSIIIDNETQEPQQARVYATDYRFFADGSNEYGDPGVLPRSNAAWIRFSPATMTVPPSGSVTISYSVDVPDSLDGGPIVGTYWSMLMIEAIAAGSAESTQGQEAGEDRTIGFSQVTRYGVQIATHLESNGEKNVEFDGIQLVADEEGGTFFQADIINSGSLMIRPEVYMRVFDEEGTEFGPFNGVQYRLYPGTSVRQRIELIDLPTGAYDAVLIVDDGDDAVFGGQFQLNL